MKDLKIFTQNIEQEALEQINVLLSQEAFKDAKVRIMPDVHSGKGCVIGFTANLGNKVIPNIVGVDIGCGVLCANLGKVDIDLESLDNFIKQNIPSGRNIYEKLEEYTDEQKLVYMQIIDNLYCLKKLKNYDLLGLSLGTLGGGNHFIEIDVDEQNNKYLIIHTGSRNLGKQVAEIYQNIAIENIYESSKQLEIKKTIEKLKLEGKNTEIQKELEKIKQKYKNQNSLITHKELCYLENEDRDLYLYDMKLCQTFASRNRHKILQKILNFLEIEPIEIFESIHNYIDDNNMVRKGAISAYKGQKLIIPLNMKDGSIIGIGKGNIDWNESAPHGAGRILSRIQAKKTLSIEDFKKNIKGIYTTTANEKNIDESPMVYKNSKEIIKNIKDTVQTISVIKPIYNFKASED